LQLFGQTNVPNPPTPLNNGFVKSYAQQLGHDGRPIGLPAGKTVMQCLDPTLVPVISRLAKSFVVCDHWHSSVPGPTWPNRFFLHAATSNGVYDSPKNPDMIASQFWGSKYRARTIYENLLDHGHSWKIYFGDHPQSYALRN